MNDLSEPERALLRDVQLKWLAARPGHHPRPPVTNTQDGIPDTQQATVENSQRLPEGFEERFFLKVFDRWNGSVDQANIPTLAPRRSVDTCTRVGTFKEDLPEPVARKRKRGENQPPSPPKAWRRRGAVAYLNPTLNYGQNTIHYQWKDAKGAFVNWAYVQLDEGLDQGGAYAKAASNYDEAEYKRVVGYNTDLGVAIVRRRIVEFAKHQDSAAPWYNLEEDYPEFEKL